MSTPDEPDEVLQQSLRLLEPVVRLLLRNGIDHPRFAAALKRVFVDVALDELARPTPPSSAAPAPATHTAVSLRTGLQRRDVKALRDGASVRFPAKALSPTLPMQVVARWTTDPAYLDHDGNPRPLPLRDADKSAVSFEILTDGLSKDIHAPALRDELVRLGLARDDDGLISLLAAGFAPARDSVQLLGAMARNGHDHLAAAVANVLDGSTSTYWHSKWSGAAVPLPHSITIDMHKTDTVAALKYLPRTNSSNGRIGRFEIHASPDGANWGAAVATGTWADSALEKTTVFTPVATRFVRLTAITEAGNRGPWTSAAELNLVAETGTTQPPPAPAPAALTRTGWIATASDQETTRENGSAANVLDGSLTTIWHSRYSPTVIGLPHSIVLDMRATNEVSGFTYTPRSGTSRNGTIGRYAIAVSSDGSTWMAPVASGTWADNNQAKTVTFPAVQARYIRLTATTEAGNRGQWTTAAELNVIGRSLSAPPPDLTPTGSKGSWGATIGFPLVPAAVALLPGNKLLTWSSYSNTTFGGANGKTQTAILDLNTGVVTPLTVANTGHDIAY